MNEDDENINKGNRITIILVVVMFISPLVLSWYVFNYTDFIQMRGVSNKGDLVVPVRPVGDLALIDPFNDERKDSLYGEWNLKKGEHNSQFEYPYQVDDGRENNPSSDDKTLILRGGSWAYYSYGVRLSARGYDPPHVGWNYNGFRVVALPSGRF